MGCEVCASGGGEKGVGGWYGEGEGVCEDHEGEGEEAEDGVLTAIAVAFADPGTRFFGLRHEKELHLTTIRRLVFAIDQPLPPQNYRL